MAHSRDPRRRRFDLSPILNWANALRALGVVGFLHELLIYDGPERAQVLVFCGLLLGLPTFAGLDKNGRK